MTTVNSSSTGLVHQESQNPNHLKIYGFLEHDSVFSVPSVQPANLQQLCNAIISIWPKISEECFRHVVESIPKRSKAVLKAKKGSNQILARCKMYNAIN